MVTARRSRLTEESVPARGDPDRKRALNVLAQRRYRRRKAEKMAALEAQVKAASSSPGSSSSRSTDQPAVSDESPYGSDEHDQVLEISSPEEADITMLAPFMATDNPVPDATSAAMLDGFVAVDQSLDFPSMQLGTDVTQLGETSTFDFDPLLSGMESPNHQFSPSYGFTPMLSSGTQIDVPLLKFMQVGMAIIDLVGANEGLWSPFTRRTFDDQSVANILLQRQITEFPAALLPTQAQKTIPHHPLLDAFPWPTVRTKLIVAFNLPPNQRPPAARDPLAIFNLFYDIEDPAEGFRVAGSDGVSDKNWEIGGKFWRTWWWAVDREIVEHTNALRRERGASRLRIEDVDHGMPA